MGLTITPGITIGGLTLGPGPPLVSMEYLVVAGGGGAGGKHQSGGAGAGGVLTDTGLFESETTITVTVGAAGTGGQPFLPGTQGGNSVLSGSGISTISAIGGGFTSTTGASGDGGSGGGSDPYNTSTPGRGVYPGSTYISAPRQGYDGGVGLTGAPIWRAGGGGGAGGVGQPGTVQSNQGGIGILSNISGTSTGYGGGGGGGCYGAPGGTAYTGYGGGNGGSDTGSDTTTSGTQNTGGGGGGTERADTGIGGSGGSGVVILRTTSTAASTTGSPTVTTDAGYNIYKFTASGSITF